MFGVHVFKGIHSELGLSIGFRNSYDKSMAIGIAIGAEVFVCDNLSLTGDITIMKKHTLNVWKGLEDAAISTLYRSLKNFEKIIADSETLKGRLLDNTEAFKMIGLMFGHGILTPDSCRSSRRNGSHPHMTTSGPGQCGASTTPAPKRSSPVPPLVIMEKHISLHSAITEG